MNKHPHDIKCSGQRDKERTSPRHVAHERRVRPDRFSIWSLFRILRQTLMTVKQEYPWWRQTAFWVVMVVVLGTGMGCEDDPEPVQPEPEVYSFFYLSVEVISPLDAKDITEIKFNGDDLKEYAYVETTIGSRRVACQSGAFVDADDALLAEDTQAITYQADADNVFEITDWNGNIVRFTPAVDGATSIIRHKASAALTDEERDAYIVNVNRQINRMPNQVFEIR